MKKEIKSETATASRDGIKTTQKVEYFSKTGAAFNIVGICFVLLIMLDYFGVFDSSIDDCSEEQKPVFIEHAKECNTNHCYHAVLEMYCGGEE